MCIRDRGDALVRGWERDLLAVDQRGFDLVIGNPPWVAYAAASYTHLRAHETVLDIVCRLLLEKKHRLRILSR